MKAYGLDVQGSDINSVARGLRVVVGFPTSPHIGDFFWLSTAVSGFPAGCYVYTSNGWSPVVPAISLSGDVSGTLSNNNIVATLASSGVTPGTYTTVGVDTKGRVIAGKDNGVRQSFGGNINQQTGTTTITATATAPTTSMGTQIMSQSVTPSSTTTRFRIEFTGTVDSSASGVAVSVFRGTTFIGLGVTTVSVPALLGSNSIPGSLSVMLYDTPGVTTAVTYSMRIGSVSTGTWYLGRTASNTYGGTNPSGWSITEII